MMNFYDLYRLILLVIALVGFISVIRQAFQYKQYYDKLPSFIQTYLIKQGHKIVLQQLDNHHQDLVINSLLLLILLGLNLLLWLI